MEDRKYFVTTQKIFQAVGNLVHRDAPAGADAGSWWAVLGLGTGGTRHGRVVAAGPYLPDAADLAQLRYSAGFTETGGRLALLVLAAKVVTALLLLLLLPLVIVLKCLSRTQ